MIFAAPARLRHARNRSAQATSALIAEKGDRMTAAILQFMSGSNWTGNLAIGASATITYSVTVNDPETGNKILANTVTSSTPGSNCPSGSTNPQCAVSMPVVTGVLSITAPAVAGPDSGVITCSVS
jgi:hypothetical protein